MIHCQPRSTLFPYTTLFRSTIEHWQFREIKTFIQRGDLVVLNDTRVLAARRFSDDDAVEFLFLERLGPTRWKCMVTPGRKMRDRKSTRLNSSHTVISYAVFC